MKFDDILKNMERCDSFEVTKTGDDLIEVTTEVRLSEYGSKRTTVAYYRQDDEPEGFVQRCVADAMQQARRKPSIWVVMQNDFPIGAALDREEARKMARKAREASHIPFIRVYEYVDGDKSTYEKSTEHF